MNPLETIEILTFDCYGALIDWESGIRDVLGRLAEAHALDVSVDSLLVEWEAIQFEMISGDWRPYREILRDSVEGLFLRHCVTLPIEEAEALGEQIGDWEPFDEAPHALARLGRRYKLAILSNIDDDMLARSVVRIGVPFDELITSEQVRSYKPAPAHFEEALRRFDAPAERFLHCAFGFKYDQTPALAAGMSTAWIRRPRAIRDDRAEPTVEVDSLRQLTELLGVDE